MNDLSRREAVKMVAGLGLGMGALAAQDTAGAETAQPADKMLQDALENPSRFMFTAQRTFKTTPSGHRLFFTSALRKPTDLKEGVSMLPASMRIFRANADQDEFTRKGGLYWQCGKEQGQIQFKNPGELIMAVYDQDGTVNCYSLFYDVRC
ncbi:hypothetical protein CA11_29460 [Gimesia maris]|uniref:hypothetical protein n=1 Tax=Gimesia maris TaxID=122 RepID=UPI00118A3A59|nr:hypothetical protein [Gimesia maris]QDU15126.1 hypothetical protein CA11_29460 [Gimesia maris]|tara:strand:+ start:126 stop:578 length:453 start_codon:yes stop_codon:yes gene_type:complete